MIHSHIYYLLIQILAAAVFAQIAAAANFVLRPVNLIPRNDHARAATAAKTARATPAPVFPTVSPVMTLSSWPGPSTVITTTSTILKSVVPVNPTPTRTIIAKKAIHVPPVPRVTTNLPAQSTPATTTPARIVKRAVPVAVTVTVVKTVYWTPPTPTKTAVKTVNPVVAITVTTTVARTVTGAPANPSPTPPPGSQPPRRMAWYSPPHSTTDFKGWNITKSSYGEQNRQITLSPTNATATALQITYPALSRNPAGHIIGGTGFYASPMDLSRAKAVTLSYWVYFPMSFDFVLGGKLPGLYGGATSCSGLKAAYRCFSTRFMFRKGGLGEFYPHVEPGIQNRQMACEVGPKSICPDDITKDVSIGRGAWVFPRGRWFNLQQRIIMNSWDPVTGAPLRDGRATVWAEGRQVIDVKQMVWAIDPGVKFEGIQFETFFGGHTNKWCTPRDQMMYFGDFQLFAR